MRKVNQTHSFSISNLSSEFAHYHKSSSSFKIWLFKKIICLFWKLRFWKRTRKFEYSQLWKYRSYHTEHYSRNNEAEYLLEVTIDLLLEKNKLLNELRVQQWEKTMLWSELQWSSVALPVFQHKLTKEHKYNYTIYRLYILSWF